VDRVQLSTLLAQGKSLSEIGRVTGKDASTVGYWVRKHGLQAVGHTKYAPKGGVERSVLEEMVVRGLSMRGMARELGVSVSTVRHWLRRYEIATPRIKRLAASRAARERGQKILEYQCPYHGEVQLQLVPSKGFRCGRCASEAVTRRRRRVKAILVAEAGGRCALCGYERYVGALEFHHRDPVIKAFGLSEAGVTRSLEIARREAAKCALLCSNCHAEVEGGIVTLPL